MAVIPQPSSPLVPLQRMCPCRCVLCARLPPPPYLPPHHAQDTKNTCVSRVFRVRRLSYPSPCPQHEYCALVGTIFMLGHFSYSRIQRTHACRVFFVFGSSLPFPCSPSRRTCPCGHVLRAPLPPHPSTALPTPPLHTNTKTCPYRHTFVLGCALLTPTTLPLPTPPSNIKTCPSMGRFSWFNSLIFFR